jgi:hypothetical protein
MIDHLGVILLGIPDIYQGLVGIGSSIVLLLIIIALGGFVYKSLTGGIEWPSDREEDPEGVSRGTDEDEWKYY